MYGCIMIHRRKGKMEFCFHLRNMHQTLQNRILYPHTGTFSKLLEVLKIDFSLVPCTRKEGQQIHIYKILHIDAL